ncbi:MAG: glycosyltransferase [Candidatus Eremiobacteraeota bacterium]|nr:glycosyltransferase [Candidatus Eremiobacteraeota bacterium]MBC5827173.1 glycosyltransferase [Candidatus Eremiobacteraeota bacterium]
MADASVIVATKDRAGALRVCLAGLLAQRGPALFETIVVDNGSADDTSSVIREFAGRELRGLYVAEPNRAKARNAGIAQARGRIVIFCDDDTFAPPRFVQAHLAAHAAGRAVVSGPIVNVADLRRLPRPNARHYSRAFLCSCNASVARSDLLEVCGFDERYDLYGWEDTDLGVRLRRRGLRRVFSQAAYLYHVKPPQRLSLVEQLVLAREKGTMAARFVRKSPSWPVKFATGAYWPNIARAAVVHAAPLRKAYRALLNRSGTRRSVAARWAELALVDGEYVDALVAGLRSPNA